MSERGKKTQLSQTAITHVEVYRRVVSDIERRDIERRDIERRLLTQWRGWSVRTVENGK